ncbi:MAG: Ig-like domain-containing protein, partial [Candidatus Muiribacteriaceae bacterium]
MKRLILIFLIIINISVFADVKVIDTKDKSDDVDITLYNGRMYTAFKAGTDIMFTYGSTDGSDLIQAVKVNSSTMTTAGKPSIAVDTVSNRILVFWTGKINSDTYKKVYYSSSSLSSISFTSQTSLVPTGVADENFTDVKAAVNSSRICVAMVGVTSSTPYVSKVYVGTDTYDSLDSGDLKNTTDNASIFRSDHDSEISSLGLDVGSNSDFNIVFEREYDGVLNIFHKSFSGTSSVSDGDNFGEPIPETLQNIGNFSFKSFPHMIMDGNSIVITYQDRSTGINRLKAIKSSDGGVSWDIQVVKGSLTYTASNPTLAKVGTDLFVLWCEDDQTYTIKYKRLDFLSPVVTENSLTLTDTLYYTKDIDFEGGEDRVYYVYSAGDSSLRDVYFGQAALTEGGSGSGLTRVVSTYPENGAQNFDIGANLRIEFSAPVNAVTSGMIEFNSQNFTIDNISDTVTIVTPGSRLDDDTTYDVIVSGVIDKNGSAVVPESWSFTTGSRDLTSTGSITKSISYPNPYRGGVFRFNYSFSRPAVSVLIKVYNLRGKLI